MLITMSMLNSNNTLEALEYTDHAENLGADAALIVTPYYNKPTQSGLYEHFKTIAEKTNIPIMILPVTFIFSKTTITTKARQPNKTSGFLISPKVTNVTG